MAATAKILFLLVTIPVSQGSWIQRSAPAIFEDHMLELRRGSELSYLRFTAHGSFWDNRLQLDDPNQPATRIRYFAEEEAIRFQVFVFEGVIDRFATEREREQVPQTLVAEFTCRPGEAAVKVSQLRLHGLAELELRLVPARTETVAPFLYDNLTSSVQLVQIDEFQDHISLRITNTSAKNLIAVGVNGATRSSWPGRALLAPGDEMGTEIYKKPRERKTTEGKRPIRITCAIFEDYTFEGDPREAAEFGLRRWGYLIGLRTILPVFAKLLEDPDPEPVQTVESLFEQLRAIEMTPSERENALAIEFLGRTFGIPSDQVIQGLAVAARDSRRFMLEEIDWNARRILESDTPESVRDYLQRTLERWQSRQKTLQDDFGDW